jgi:hypothetical protein
MPGGRVGNAREEMHGRPQGRLETVSRRGFLRQETARGDPTIPWADSPSVKKIHDIPDLIATLCTENQYILAKAPKNEVPNA